MSRIQQIKEWWWEKTNGVFEELGQEWRFSRSKGEFRYHLEQRGVVEEVETKLEEEGCKCGEAEEINELTSVSKVPDPAIEKGYELELFCKECLL